MESTRQKVTGDHLRRDAYLYIRQSSLHQVFHNTESTRRQYDLRRRAVALGWPDDRVVVIDTDLGKSGASTDREGFQRLVGDVGMGKAGIVLGLEVSRLARNSSDWHRLLEICALTDTLILDEDGLYNPADFNDRLLLGMKGTMSEAELHVLRARLQGGLMNKARRGELRIPLPVGFCYDARDQVVLHPDRQVQEVVGLFFKTYRRTGSAMGVVKWFREQDILFPRTLKNGPNRGQIDWTPEVVEDEEAQNHVVRIKYPGTVSPGILRPFLQLEIGPLASWLPHSEYMVRPYAAEEFPDQFDDPKCPVRAIDATRTLWEKVMILHREAHRMVGAKVPEWYSRHYYDLYFMAKSDVKQAAFDDLKLLHEVIDFNQRFYACAWAEYELAVPGTIRLVPPEHVLDVMRKDHDSMQEMIFGRNPDFDEILTGLAELEKKINHLASGCLEI